jgi:hypothetical protein
VPAELPAASLDELRTWARGRVPQHLHDQLRVEVDLDGRDAVVVEVRPPWDGVGGETRDPVARLRWLTSRGVWQLFCLDGDLVWRRYGPRPEGSLDELLAELDTDPTCLFWG